MPLDQHGFLAEQVALDCPMDLTGERNLEGCSVWRRVQAPIRELGRTERREGESAH